MTEPVRKDEDESEEELLDVSGGEGSPMEMDTVLTTDSQHNTTLDELNLLMGSPPPQSGDLEGGGAIRSRSCSPQVSPTLSPNVDLAEVFPEGTSLPNTVGEGGGEGGGGRDSCQGEGIIHVSIPEISKIQSTVLSNPVYIRDLPWRLMIMPKITKGQEEDVRSLGVFVQCDPDTNDTPGWSVYAMARISLIDQSDTSKSLHKEIGHWFTSKENDWGYANFIQWKDLFSEDNGYVKDDTLIMKAKVAADAPHGINWDSKKHTGFVGLKNQGATCYMNSLLQTLFCTYKLRKAVYQMPTENDDSTKSVAFALQRLFYDLQYSDKVVGTKKLTKSFGWDSIDTFMQHDIQELSRVLLDNMQSKMKGTPVEGVIPKLLEGKMETLISCTDIKYESRREESFFDLQLNVKGKKSIYESIKDYTAPEILDGDNKYHAGTHGMQKAERKVSFIKFPPVLHLQLMRFQFDMYSEGHSKLNDRYEFPEHLDLNEFLKSPEATPALYTLHAVLVHSGDNFGGHYVAYINPKGDGQWLRFDDEVVSRCSVKEAVENNFGGLDDNFAVHNCTNAYMLCYIRDTELATVLEEVTDEDIPPSLVQRINQEKITETLRRKERNEAHLYMIVEVYTDDEFQLHHGPDLLDSDEIKGKSFKMLKALPFDAFHTHIAACMGYERTRIRLWPFEMRSNRTYRPGFSENLYKSTLLEAAESKSYLRIYAELAPTVLKELIPYDFQSQVLFFIKYYDPYRKSLTYLGHLTENINQKLECLFPIFRAMANLSEDTPLRIYEEVTANRIESLEPNTEISQVDDVRDGDIICFQRTDILLQTLEAPFAPMYYKELYNRLDVVFCDKNIPGDAGFTLTLNQRMSYNQMATAVGAYLQTEPYLLQFFRPNIHRQLSDQAIRHRNEGSLRDFVVARSRLDSTPYLFYQRLSIPIDEFETKKCFKCIFVNLLLKEEKELITYVDKNGTVDDLLSEALNEAPLHEGSTRKLRLLEVMGNRIIDIHPNDKAISDLLSQKIYRLEEVRTNETSLRSDEALIPVAHYQKLPHNTFGVPFLLKLKDGEKLSSVKDRIQSLLEVNDKEFDKWKFNIVNGMTMPTPLPEESDPSLYLSQFHICPEKDIFFSKMGLPWLGIDHINKNPKRTRYNIERAIKIHN